MNVLYSAWLRPSVRGFFMLALLFGALPMAVFGQCTNNNVYWTDLTPTGAGNTQTTSCIYGGEYVTVGVCQGASYTFSTCGSSWDTQITLYNDNGGSSLAYNDDACAPGSSVTWTATFDGVVRVLVDLYNCVSNSTCTALSVTQNTACPVFDYCANDNTYWTDLTPTAVGVAATSTCVYGGEYVTVDVCDGASYTFSTCGSSWDTQITVYDDFWGDLITWNDDFCGLQSSVTWTATFDGTVRVLLDQYPCTSNSLCATLSVTQNTACPTFDFCPDNNVYWTDLTPGAVGVPQTSSCVYGGEYVTVEVCQGASYTFSTCGSSWDTQITVYDDFWGDLITWNDDFCGLQSSVSWTATFDGVVRVLVDQYPCASNSTCATLSVTQNTACPTTDYCANDNTYWTDLTPAGVGQTASTTCIFGGEYVTVDVCEGASYTFSTCGSSWDTQITVYDDFWGDLLTWNDDACGLQSTVSWTAPFTGTVRVLVDLYPCQDYETCATLNVTQNTSCAGGCFVSGVFIDPMGCDGTWNMIDYFVEYSGACTVDYMYVWTADLGWETVDLTGLGFTSGEAIGIFHNFSNTYYEYYFELSDGTFTSTYWNVTGDCGGPNCEILDVIAESQGCIDQSEWVDFYIYYSGDCAPSLFWITTDGFNWQSFDVNGYLSGEALSLYLNFDNTEYLFYYEMNDGTISDEYGYFTGDCDNSSLCSNLMIDHEDTGCYFTGVNEVPSGNIYFIYSGACTVEGIWTSVNGGAFEYLDLSADGFVSGDFVQLLFNITDADYEVYYELSDGTFSPSVFFSTGNCESGETICDCAGTQLPIEALAWLGDGLLDDGTYEWNGVPVDFNCALWGFDCGDNTDPGAYDPYGVCNGNLPPANGCVVEDCYLVDLDVQTDCYPEEVSIELYNENGDLVYSQPAGTYLEEQTFYTTSICLPPGCYTFVIMDEFGDGLAGCEPYGYFGVWDWSESSYLIFGDGDSYGSYYEEQFCVGPEQDCFNLDLDISEEPCYDNGGTLQPAISYEFDFLGNCTVDALYLSENGGAFDVFDVSGENWGDGDTGYLYFLTPNANYTMYYVLSDGTASPLFTFNTGDCNNEITICDCAGTQHTIGVLDWLGDGFADDGFYEWGGQPVDFNCATWGYDCGDVPGAPTFDPYNVCGGGLPPNNGCTNEVVLGCTDPEAVNFDPDATVNDGSCIYNIQVGCTDEEACNYNEFAVIDDGSCEYITCAGCTDPDATNYDPSATIDDGSCFYEEIIGCTDEDALNYNPIATEDDGSCIYNCVWPAIVYTTTCVDGDTENFIIEMDINVLGNGAPYVVTNSYNDEQYTLNFTGVIELGPFPNNSDVVVQVFSTTLQDCFISSPILSDNCVNGVVFGCTDPLAANFNSLANEDDGSCTYDFTICDCDMEQFSPATRFQLGDGVPNTGAGALPNFNCSTWGYDCGDINGAPNEDPYSVCSGFLPPLFGCEDNVQELSGGSFALFPNPGNGQFSVRNDGHSGPVMMRVFDSMGRKVFEQQLVVPSGSFIAMDLRNLASGSYRVAFTSDEINEYHQLLIQR